MTNLRQAAQMALEALEQQHRDRTAYSIAKQAANATCAEFKNNTLSELIDSGYRHSEMGKRTVSAIDALRAALAAVQEPVAWAVMQDGECIETSTEKWVAEAALLEFAGEVVPLYAHPAPAAQPLTAPQMHRLWRSLGEGEGIEEFASAVIAEFCRINGITLGGTNADA